MNKEKKATNRLGTLPIRIGGLGYVCMRANVGYNLLSADVCLHLRASRWCTALDTFSSDPITTVTWFGCFWQLFGFNHIGGKFVHLCSKNHRTDSTVAQHELCSTVEASFSQEYFPLVFNSRLSFTRLFTTLLLFSLSQVSFSLSTSKWIPGFAKNWSNDSPKWIQIKAKKIWKEFWQQESFLFAVHLHPKWD